MADEEMEIDDGTGDIEAPDGDFDTIDEMIEAAEAGDGSDDADGAEDDRPRAATIPTAEEVDEELGAVARSRGEDDGDGERPEAARESHSRMVRKLAQRERELTEHRSTLR